MIDFPKWNKVIFKTGNDVAVSALAAAFVCLVFMVLIITSQIFVLNFARVIVSIAKISPFASTSFKTTRGKGLTVEQP